MHVSIRIPPRIAAAVAAGCAGLVLGQMQMDPTNSPELKAPGSTGIAAAHHYRSSRSTRMLGIRL